VSKPSAGQAAVSEAFEKLAQTKIAEGWSDRAAYKYAEDMLVREVVQGRLDRWETLQFLNNRNNQPAQSDRDVCPYDRLVGSAPPAIERAIDSDEQCAQMIADSEGISLAKARTVMKARFPQSNLIK
jgi:hypothetical protein